MKILWITKKLCGNARFFVPSVGIEPALQDPESCVLSVERRGLFYLCARQELNLHSFPPQGNALSVKLRALHKIYNLKQANKFVQNKFAGNI